MRRQANCNCSCASHVLPRPSRRSVLGCLYVAIVLCGSQVYASPTPPNPIQVSYSLSKTTIVSGEFVSIIITAVNAGDKTHSLRIDGNHVFKTDVFSIIVSGADGAVIGGHKRIPPIYSKALVKMLHYRIRTNESISISYPIHLQWDTHFPAGEYIVCIAPLSITVGGQCYTIPSASMKLKVVGEDNSCLMEKYDELLRSNFDRKVVSRAEWRKIDLMDIPAGSLELLCAYGKEAVGSQVRFLYTKNYGFAYWPEITIYAWDNIAQYATAEVIEELISIVDDPEFAYGGFPGKNYDPGIIWCLHRIYECSDSNESGRLREICDMMPERCNFEAAQYSNE